MKILNCIVFLILYSCCLDNAQDASKPFKHFVKKYTQKGPLTLDRASIGTESFKQFAFANLNEAINDSLIMKFDSGGFCFNHDLDSLANSEFSYDLKLVDVRNNEGLITWSPFLGRIQCKKLSENKYAFEGLENLPISGDWEIPFVEYQTIRYILQIYDQHYAFYRDPRVQLNLNYSEKRIAELEKEIMNSDICLSDNWDTADVCFSKIEEYEYHLFASILDGELDSKERYFNLRSNISAVNAGQFSEYIEGNYYLLRLYGIADDNDYDYKRLSIPFGIGDKEVCY